MEMKKPSKKVLKTALQIISEGEEGMMLNAGQPDCPSEQDVIKATALLENFILGLRDSLKNNPGG